MASQTYCKVWAVTEETPELFLTGYMLVLTVCGLLITLAIRSLSRNDMQKLLREAGVAIDKVAKTAMEIERKVFHLAGLLVPFCYQVLLQRGVPQRECSRICWSITICGWSLDVARLKVPFVQRNWPLRSILRDREQAQLCGGSYFSLGCTLAVHLFPPVIAMTSIIFLVMGDMSAALIGRSFGRCFFKVGIGPGGKKSFEGSVAMFVVCFVFGCTIFSQVHLREYAVVIAALTATLVELYEPFGLNDNVTIPVLSSMALTFGFERTYFCDPGHNPLLWYSRAA